MFKSAALTASILVATTAMTAPLKGQDWASKARQDIAVAHDVIRDNHPGPVDTLNPRFKDWLEKGESLAIARANAATTESDYWRALTFYINGFQDGHLTVRRNGSVTQVWPGFLTATDASGVTRITVSTIAAAPIGARIIECDGVPATRLLDERVHPYFTNAGIPHERLLTASYLFVGETGDRPKLVKACTIETGVGALRHVLLDWKPIDKADLAQR